MGFCKSLFKFAFLTFIIILFVDRIWIHFDIVQSIDQLQQVQPNLAQNQKYQSDVQNEEIELINQVLQDILGSVKNFNLVGLESVESLNFKLPLGMSIFLNKITLFSFKSDIKMERVGQKLETILRLNDIKGQIQFNNGQYAVKLQIDELSASVGVAEENTNDKNFQTNSCKVAYKGFDIDVGLVSAFVPFHMILNNFLTQSLVNLGESSLIELLNEYVFDIFNQQYYQLQAGEFSIDIRQFDDEPTTPNNQNQKKDDL